MATRFSACIGGMLLLISSGLAAQTLVYEREYTLIAEAENTLRLEVSPDDQVFMDRPVFMTYPGRHTFRAPVGTYDRLRRAFETARTDTDRLHRDIQQRAANEMQVVTDPEFSRFALVDSDRGPIDVVTVVSLEAWASRIDDQRLQRLSALEDELFAMMNAILQEKTP